MIFTSLPDNLCIGQMILPLPDNLYIYMTNVLTSLPDNLCIGQMILPLCQITYV